MTAVTPEEVDRFLQTAEFTGYQAVPLPYGRMLPGKDRAPTAEIALGRDLTGKTLLDVGTCYGFLPYQASRRGAKHSVGLEPDPNRFKIAHRVSELNGGYEIHNTSLEQFTSNEQFDVVCLLNVLHHLIDPIQSLRRLGEVCAERLVIEFCLADDPAYIGRVIEGGGAVSRWTKLRARIRSNLIRVAAGDLPLMALGNQPYYRVFYFSPAALRNLIVTHLKVASSVEFVPIPQKRRRMLAICNCNGS